MISRKHFIVFALLIALFSPTAPIPRAFAVGTPAVTITGVDGVAPNGTDSFSVNVSNFDTNASFSVVLSVASGTLTVQKSGSATRLTGYNDFVGSPATVTASEIGFQSTYAELQTMLSSVTFTAANSPGSISLSVSIAERPAGSNVFYWPGDGSSNSARYYKSVTSSGINWATAESDAKSDANKLGGIRGYLVRPSTYLENKFLAEKTTATNIWIAASRGNSVLNDLPGSGEQNWYWTTDSAANGPSASENGIKFFDEGTDLFYDSNGTQSNSRWLNNGTFVNPWSSGEPNGGWSGTSGLDVENKAVTNWNNVPGKWNDLLATNSSNVSGYVIEYNAHEMTSLNSVVTTSTYSVTAVPTITSISPAGGSVSGGEVVTLVGAYFSSATEVRIGAVTLTKVANNVASSSLTAGQWSYQTSSTNILLKTPDRSATVSNLTVGAQQVVVKNSDGDSTSQQFFTYRPNFESSPSNTRVVLGDLGSRSKAKPIVRTSTSPFTVTGTDSITAESYSYETDYDYVLRRGSHPAYYRESIEDTTSISFTGTVTTPDATQVKLDSSIQCSHDNNAPAGSGTVPGGSTKAYCSVFGPEIYTEAFYATTNQSLSFDWKAEGGGDHYEVYAFLVSVSDTTAIPTPNTTNNKLLVHGMGSSISNFVTSAAAIPANGLYRFRFVNGSYDASGGQALGASMYIKKAVTIGDANVITFPSLSDQIASSGTYSNFTFNLTSTSGAQVNVTASGKCTVGTPSYDSQSKITTVTVSNSGGAGTCSITASQGASGTYAPAANVTKAFDYLASATAPSAPTITSITGTAGGLSVSFSPPNRDGGASITNYQYSLNGGSFTLFSPADTTTPLEITGLTGGVTYAIKLKAVNSVGAGAESNSVSALTLADNKPNSVIAIAGVQSAVVSWSAPAVGTVTSYTVTSTPGSLTCTTSSLTCTVSGLSAGTAYTFTVTATFNDSSTSTSLASAAVTPTTENSNSGGGTPNATPTTTPTPTPTRTTAPIVRNTPLLSGPVNTGTNVNQLGNTPQTLIGGVPTNTTTRVVDQSKLNVLAGALNLEIQVPQNVGSVTNTGGTTQLQVQKGGITTINGSGLRPLSTVQVFLPLGGNNSRELARIPVTSSGTFNGLATFANPTQGAPLPIGPQVLQIVSVDPAGRQAVVEMKVNIAQPAPAPEQNRANGQLPELTPGQSIATEAGLPVPVTVEAIEQQRQAIIQGDTWQMSINVPNANGEVTKTDGGALLKFIQNESVFVEGDGFLPGTRADVWLFSDPTLLGTVEIDENGGFSGQIAVDGKFVPTGEHTLQVQGVGDDGFVRSANLGVIVEANPVSATSGITSIWIYALVAVGLGATWWFFLIARRRRKEAKHS